MLFGTRNASGGVSALKSDSDGRLEATLGTKIAGEDITVDVLKVVRCGNVQKITNVTSRQEIKTSSAYLHAILVQNSPGSDSTITIQERDSNGNYSEIFTVNVPANTRFQRYDLNFYFPNGFGVQPNSSSLNFVVVWS